MTFAALLLILNKYKRPIIVVAVIIALIALALFARSCYYDYKENQLREELDQIIERQRSEKQKVEILTDDSKSAEKDAENASNRSESLEKELEGIENRNANVDMANQSRCRAYPNAEGCR